MNRIEKICKRCGLVESECMRTVFSNCEGQRPNIIVPRGVGKGYTMGELLDIYEKKQEEEIEKIYFHLYGRKKNDD